MDRISRFKKEMLDLYSEVNLRHSGDISATIGYLNHLLAETTEVNLYVTSFTCKLDAASGDLEYINAGHPPPLVVRGGATPAGRSPAGVPDRRS